ncbi:bifunctional metallophosphatase/5'-nucleotidase [Clostridium akagii]|uniref:bifunctional metallophosphatase/5'-nucleotidase n=1 Tax=Clostridium akagii TaxID=91623 RepID=UPI00047D4B7E|nr:bifunctional metallophosphatase/5'-nucleotidase [Clostridium akagii]
MNNNLTKIVILETSDVHGNILPISYANNESAECGISKIATIIERERENNENIVLIDNGDMIQGTPLTYYYAKIDNKKANPIIDVLNYLKYDAGVIGNHEFNYGRKILDNAIKQSEFPWLSANILAKATNEPFCGKPYVIKEFSTGVRVGILGLTTKYIPNWENPDIISDLNFLDVVEAAKKWIEILKQDEKVDLVIVSYHGGFERNLQTGEVGEKLTGENQAYQLCMEVEGIDVLLTGHQHRYIENKIINGVVVVQPGSGAKAIGRVEVSLEKHNSKWRVVEKFSNLIYCDGEQSDKKIEDIVEEVENDTQVWLDTSIGKINGDMKVHDYFQIRIKDSALIEFINRVQMDSSGAEISNTALFDNNSKGFSSKVTMRDIVSNYIYPNTLKVIEVLGEDIKAALEKSASYFEIYDGEGIKMNPKFEVPKPQHYNYDMWEGIEYDINISRTFGHRITKLNYLGKPMELNKKYHVVMNNYRAGGGGDFYMFKDKPVMKDIPIDMSELIANYILARGTIEATVNENWKVIHD